MVGEREIWQQFSCWVPDRMSNIELDLDLY